MLTVMIIEDEPSAMERYSNYVESYDSFLSVIAKAYTAEEGWAAFQKERPDIIFSDIKIPGGNGLDLITKYRNTGWNGDLVIISGYDDFSYARKAIQLNVFDYILKPVFQNDFNKILDRLMEKHHKSTGDFHLPRVTDSKGPEHIYRAKKYIAIHLEQEITLKAAAEYAFVSPAYLSSSFHKICGNTFIEYIRRIRIEKAMELLRQTSLPVKIIGEKCGLSDPSYFNRSFRKMTGKSPGQYRREYRQE